jgi:hypothetical protein
MKTPFSTIAVSLSLLLLGSSLGACASEDDTQETPPPGASSGSSGSVNPQALECTEKPQGRTYVDFGGIDLATSRANENIGVNRGRIKPYSVLAGEYTRVLGAAPASLPGQAGSFDVPDPRYFEEPRATGVGISAMYGVSFEGALVLAKANAKYATAPDATSAPTECAAFLGKAFSRTPNTEEINACAAFATSKLGKETNPQRKWAYVFANVLTSTGFLTY